MTPSEELLVRLLIYVIILFPSPSMSPTLPAKSEQGPGDRLEKILVLNLLLEATHSKVSREVKMGTEL